MGWFEDACAWVENAVEDVGEAVAGAVEDAVDWVEDAVEDVGEVVEDVVEGIGEAAEDVAEWTLNALDDTVFDTVDFITGGVIDVDYDDGQFSAGLDIGIASVGVSFGDQGFSAESSFDIGLASGEISYDSSDGLAMSGSIGVDFGPLPYAEGHMSWSPDGEISIGGVIQGTLPLPFGGEIGGSLSGGFERNADGSWGATADLDFDVSTGLTGDISLDATSSVGRDSEGDFYRESDTDVFIDHNRDGIDDREDDDFDDMVDGGVFGGVKDPSVRPGPETAAAGSADPAGGAADDDLMQHLQEAADSYADISGAVGSLGQDLVSDTTRPALDDDILAPAVSDDGFDDGFDGGLDPGAGATAGGAATGIGDTFAADAAFPEAGAPIDDAFAPTDDFGAVDTLVEPIADIPAPEPLPEPPPSDFAVEIDTIETVEVEADEMWDDLG